MRSVYRGLLILLSLLACETTILAQDQDSISTPVVSAVIEDVNVKPDRQAVQFEIRNLGVRPITGFMAKLTRVGADGTESLCNGGGADMIDWSDPMPGTNIVFGMRRNWIQPGQAIRSERYFMDCSDLATSPGAARVHLTMVMFDDGTGEGSAPQIQFSLQRRQQLREASIHWVTRFTALRNAENLHAAAAQLYQDLVNAKHDAEADPKTAARTGVTRGWLERVQRLALEITQWSESHPVLNERESWQITDMEQRTERLVRGAGPSDPPTAP